MPTPEPRPAATLATTPRPPRRRRLLRLVLTLLLLVLDLGLLAYVLRRPLFENWIRAAAATELSALLAAEVEIGAIGGNWLDSIHIEGVALRGRESDLLRDVQDLTVSASFSPWQLLRGEPAGLLAVRVHARRVAIETTGRPPGPAAAGTGAAAKPPDFAAILRLLPRGAELRVDELVFGAGDHRRQGAFVLALAPGGGRRRVHLEHGALAADLDVSPGPGGTPSVAATLRAGDPAQLLACLGLAPLPVTGGTAVVDADVALAPLRIAAHCRLAGLRGARAALQHGAFAAVLDERRLEVQFGEVDLDGLRFSTSGLGMPSPLGAAPLALADVAGDVELRIDDLQPWRELLPAEVRALLPVTGGFRGWIDRGTLHVGECRLVAPGWSFAIEQGRLALADPASLPGSDLALRFALDVPAEREFVVGGVPARGSGRITGSFAGSLTAPIVDAVLALGPSGYDRWAAARIGAALSFAGGELHVRELAVEGVTAEGAEGSARVDGSCDLTLPAAGRVLSIAAAVRGEGHPGLLTAAGLDPELAARGRPFTFSVSGRVALPADAPPTGDGRIGIEDLAVGELPAATVVAEVKLTPVALHVERCSLSGPGALELRGDVPLAPGGVLDLALEATDQDLKTWSLLLLPEAMHGSLSVRARAQGTFGAPVVEIDVGSRLDGLGPLAAHWPPALGAPPPGPWQVRLRARHGDAGIAVEELTVASAAGAPVALRLDGHGTIPWHFDAAAGPELRAGQDPFVLALAAHGRFRPESDLPWQVAATLAVAQGRTELRSVEVAAGPGSLRGSGSLALGFAHAFSPPADFGAAAVAASAQLADLRLETLPQQFTGLAAATGSLRGELTLRGTLAQPQPEARLQLADAQIRAPGAPRITDLSGRIEADPRRIAVTGLRAKMGASPVTFAATLTSRDPLWADPAGIEVHARLQGEQALVVNTPTLKVRGDVDLTAGGTLAALQVRGKVAVTTGRYAQRITALPGLETLRGRGGAGTGEGIVLRLLEPALGQRIELDVAVTTRRDFEVRTHTLDTDLRLDLRVRGDASAARLVGTVAASSGVLRLPGSTMALRSLLVTFLEQQPFHPGLQLLAEGRRHGYRVQAVVRGTTRSPEIVLSSTPALPSEDLLVLVTTGSLPERLREQGGRGQATLVGTYLAQELAAWYLGGDTTEAAGETFFDRITVESGREVSDEGLETVLIEFKLTDMLSLQGERDVYEDINGGLCLRWRFR